jgi:hypothetical protein
MSEWRDGINWKALARLDKRCRRFSVVCAYPRDGAPLRTAGPRLAIDSPARASGAGRSSLALAAKSGGPAGWTWRLADEKPDCIRRRDHKKSDWLMWSFRVPPAPYRERNYALGPVLHLRPAVYRFGWHMDLWGGGANRNAVWHAACVVAWDLWMAPVIMRVSSSAYSNGAAPRPAGGYGRPPGDHRVPLFGCGASTAARGGHHCLASGAYRPGSSIATCIWGNAPRKHGPVAWPRMAPGGRPIADRRSGRWSRSRLTRLSILVGGPLQRWRVNRASSLLCGYRQKPRQTELFGHLLGLRLVLVGDIELDRRAGMLDGLR